MTEEEKKNTVLARLSYHTDIKYIHRWEKNHEKKNFSDY